jgi:hypothetical protein
MTALTVSPGLHQAAVSSELGQQRRVAASPLTTLRQVSPQSCRGQRLRQGRVKLIGLYKESDHERKGNDLIEPSAVPSTLE